MREIAYQVVRSRKRKKTLTLKISREGAVVIHVPHSTPREEIERFFREKLHWVRRKLTEKETVLGRAGQRNFTPGELFPYLGETYPLTHRDQCDGRSLLTLSRGVFILEKGQVPRGRELFVRWYKERAREIFHERVRYYSRQLGLWPKKIRITSARSRYGSCSPDNSLSFTFRLVMAPYPMIDYVIVHELAHIKIKNHSRTFWNFMEEIMPDYKNRRKWLKDNSVMLDV